MDRLQLIVRDYIRRHRHRKRSELDHFKCLPSLEDAISWSALGKDERGKRHPHQRRLKLINLQRSKHRLMGVADELVNCISFSELIEAIHNEVGVIKGLGPLYCYDTALRLGAYLGIFPDRVYLHAGTSVGASALGIDRKIQSVNVERLPHALRELQPYEIEDLLCIYKDQLKQVAR